MKTVAKILGINVLVLVALAFVGHRRLLSRLPPGHVTKNAEGITPELLHSLGVFVPDPERRKLADLTKAAAAKRVVALGDSFTYGQEVVTSLAYPSLLAGHLRRAGADAKVINLGCGWHGLSQTTRLYEEMVKPHAPDIVLLGPEGFYLDRELTFNHGEENMSDYVHGRYIVRDGQLAFLDVLPGDAGGYYDFPPHWQYLRYDRLAPPFLRGLLPAGRTLANPFYALKSTPQEEQGELFEKLFARIADGPHRTIIGYEDEHIATLARSITTHVPIEVSYGALYLRPRHHYSGLGNDLIARRYCQAIMDRGCPSPSRIVLDDPSERPGDIAIGEGDDAFIIVNGHPLASLHEVAGERTRLVDTQMLIALGRTSWRPLLDSLWLRLPRKLGAVDAVATYEDGTREVIGALSAMNEGQTLAALVTPKHELHRSHRITTATGFEASRLPATITLGDLPIARVQREGSAVVVSSLLLPFVVFAAREDDYVDVDTLPDHGDTALQVGAAVIPFGSWKRTKL